MRKTNRNIRKINFLKRIIALIGVEVIIVGLFSYAHYANEPIREETTKNITIVVDEVNSYYDMLAKRHVNVVANGVVYKFPRVSPIVKEFSMSELYETIHPGDTLWIRYVESSGLLGLGPPVNSIVDARTETEQLRSIEAFNQVREDLQTIGIITFCILEFIFMVIVVSYFVINVKCLKLFYKKKKHVD